MKINWKICNSQRCRHRSLKVAVAMTHQCIKQTWLTRVLFAAKHELEISEEVPDWCPYSAEQAVSQ